MAHNPYAPPRAPVNDGGSQPGDAPAARLYSPAQIGVATFIGGLIPGAQFAAANLRLLGRRAQAGLTLLIGITVTILMPLATRSLSPANTILVTIVASIAAFSIAHWVFWVKCRTHRDAGGRLYSWWRVVGISLAWAIVGGAALVAYAYYTQPTALMRG